MQILCLGWSGDNLNYRKLWIRITKIARPETQPSMFQDLQAPKTKIRVSRPRGCLIFNGAVPAVSRAVSVRTRIVFRNYTPTVQTQRTPPATHSLTDCLLQLIRTIKTWCAAVWVQLRRTYANVAGQKVPRTNQNNSRTSTREVNNYVEAIILNF